MEGRGAGGRRGEEGHSLDGGNWRGKGWGGGGGGALSLIHTTGLILNNNKNIFSFLCLHTAVQSIFVLHELETIHCTIGNGGGSARSIIITIAKFIFLYSLT